FLVTGGLGVASIALLTLDVRREAQAEDHYLGAFGYADGFGEIARPPEPVARRPQQLATRGVPHLGVFRDSGADAVEWGHGERRDAEVVAEQHLVIVCIGPDHRDALETARQGPQAVVLE